MKKWQCSVCKYIHTGDKPPVKCPVCGVGSDNFVLLEDTGSPDSDIKKEAPTPAKKSVEPGPASVTEPANLYEKITDLMVKHHAHPVSVHIPNGIMPACVILFILAWIFDADLFVKVGFINLIFVVLALPFVLFSGVMEWKKRYAQALTTIFKIKIMAAVITTTTCILSISWYLIDPNVLASSRAWIFILVNIVMLSSAGIAGHIGGKLVFKD